MRTIIAGSRIINDFSILEQYIKLIHWPITVILSGNAKGVDKLGEKYARINGIPLEIYPAHWTSFGKKAGMIRNEQMISNADALFCLWDGKSKGTNHIINLAKADKLKVFVKIV